MQKVLELYPHGYQGVTVWAIWTLETLLWFPEIGKNKESGNLRVKFARLQASCRNLQCLISQEAPKHGSWMKQRSEWRDIGQTLAK